MLLKEKGMKRILILLVLVCLLLSACGQQATPTATDAEMSTKIAQILTNMPTATGQATKVVNTATGQPSAVVTKAAATTAPAASATPAAATATQKPAEATKAPTLAVTPTIAAPAASATVAATATTNPTTGPTATKAAPTNTPSGPTLTAVAGDPRLKLGTPTWTDKMNDGGNWPTGEDPSGFTQVAFNNGFMELTSLKQIDGWRLSFERLGNAYLEMSVNSATCLPKDRYGVIVRVPVASEANRGYLLGFTCDGKFAIRKWDGAANVMSTFINWKTNAAIQAGANKTNRLGVMMQGSKLSLYANGILLGEVSDLAWDSGNFGIFAGAHESSSYTAKIDQLDYWKLP
jgi:hypothetical protein